MTPTSSSLADWQHLLLLSSQMLTLAKTQQWEALISGELAYIQRVEALSSSHRHVSESAYPSKMREILRQLLENEAEVKQLLLTRMDQLKVLIHQGNQQQSVNLAYGKLEGMLLLPTNVQNSPSVVKSE